MENKTIFKFSNYFFNIKELTKRNILIFLRNKTTLFFSVIAPVLILVIYILFMGDYQVSLLMESFGSEVNINAEQVKSFANAWMISGILGLSTLTVALNSMFIIIADRENEVINDFTASPVSLVSLTLSYFISAVILTIFTCFIFLLIGLIYLYISSNLVFNFVEILQILSILIIASLSAVIILMFITSFFKKTSTAASFTGIFSALIGFLIGSYMPISILPEGIQNFANIIPGSHATGLFRQVFIDKAIKTLDNVEVGVINNLKENYGYNLELFGYEFNTTTMFTYVFISTIAIFIIHIIIRWRR